MPEERVTIRRGSPEGGDAVERECAQWGWRDWVGVFDAAGAPLWIVSSELRLVFVNAAYCEFIQLPREGLLGRYGPDLFSEEEAGAWRARDAQVLETGEPVVIEEMLKDSHGETRVYRTRLSCFVDERGQCFVVGLSQEVTDLRRAEARLRRSESQLNHAQRIAHIGSYAWDATTRTYDFSREFYRLYGFEEADDQPTFEAVVARIHPADRAPLLKLTEQTLSRHETYPVDYRLLLPDGTLRYVHAEARWLSDEAGQWHTLIGTVQDVTERKLAEWELQRHQAVLAEAELLGAIGTWEVELVSRRIYLSENLARLYGIDRERFDGSFEAFWPIIHPDDRGWISEWLREGFDSQGPAATDFRIVRPDGSVRQMHSNATMMRDDQGQAIKLVGFVQDVTDRKRIEQELAERARELEQANQSLQELDRFKNNLVNTVSHELRTPLTSIVGYAEFLEERLGGALTTIQAEFVAEIQKAAARLGQLVDELLDFARIQAGTFKLQRAEAELQPLVAEVLASMRPQANEARLVLSGEWPETPVRLCMDRKRIGQVLLNLLGNAIKFTPPGGRIRVVVRSKGDRVRLEVVDTGIGVDAAHLPQLFEKFYQVESGSTRARGGAGLGLSIAKALTEAHGGQIGAESTLNAGSTFWVTLPLAGCPDGEELPKTGA